MRKAKKLNRKATKKMDLPFQKAKGRLLNKDIAVATALLERPLSDKELVLVLAELLKSERQRERERVIEEVRNALTFNDRDKYPD